MNKNKILILSIITSFFGFMLFVPTNTSALSPSTAQSLCNIKRNKTACVEAVTKCATQKDCQTVLAKYANVVLECRKVDDPQACDKAVRDKCKIPAANADRTCVVNAAAKFSSTSGGAVGANNGSDLGDDPNLDATYLEKKFACGKVDPIKTQFDLGCMASSKDPNKRASAPDSGIVDLAYSIIRFLSIGVGLVVVASMILAGIMYATSGGNPETTTQAKNRIRETIIALVFYSLIFALVQYLVPGGLFK